MYCASQLEVRSLMYCASQLDAPRLGPRCRGLLDGCCSHLPLAPDSCTCNTWVKVSWLVIGSDVIQVRNASRPGMGLVVPCRFGSIGHRVAQLARAYEMRVVALRRSVDKSTADVDCGLLVSGSRL